MPFYDRFLDKNVVCIGLTGACAALAALTSSADNYPALSPAFSLIGASILGYYGWSTINSLIEDSAYYYKKLWDNSDNSDKANILHDLGREGHYANTAEFSVKLATGANIFVNSVKTILCNDEKAIMAANTITPLAFAATFCGLTFFSSRIESLRYYDERIHHKQSVSSENVCPPSPPINPAHADDTQFVVLDGAPELSHNVSTQRPSISEGLSLTSIAGVYRNT